MSDHKRRCHCEKLTDGTKPALVDIKTAAEHIGVAVSWLYKQSMAKTIPFYKVGKYNRYNLSELDEFLTNHCRRGPAIVRSSLDKRC